MSLSPVNKVYSLCVCIHGTTWEQLEPKLLKSILQNKFLFFAVSLELSSCFLITHYTFTRYMQKLIVFLDNEPLEAYLMKKKRHTTAIRDPTTAKETRDF